MRQASCCLAIAVAAFLLPQTQVAGQEYAPVHADNPVLAASLERIAQGSALWRSDLDAIRAAGRQALVLTTDAVLMVEPTASAASNRPSAMDSLAEVSLVRRGATAVSAVLVVINLPWLEQAHDRRHSTVSDRAADLDRIVIHEVYGHAFPYLVAGDISGRCADPEPGERALDACSITRENAVRAELKLGRRTDYSLSSLALSRPIYGFGFEGGNRRRH